jgi:hypothetical protein
MAEQMVRNDTQPKAGARGGRAPRPDLKDPRVILSLLEADQVVAAKTQSRFGRRSLSVRTRAALWGLRIYVLLMMVIVVISVIQAVHGGP